MKAFLEIIGESRCPVEGELILWRDNVCQARAGDCNIEYPIVTRHEIRIHPDAKTIDIDIRGESEKLLCDYGFLVPPPKKKVKKWRWEISVPHPEKPVTWRTEQHFSEEEMKRFHDFDRFSYHRAVGTKIEVEE